MTKLPNHVLALQIENPRHFVSRFGQAISIVIWNEFIEAFYHIAHTILSRHPIFSPVIAPVWGKCFIFFKFDESLLAFDLEEQMNTITSATGHMVRHMLQAHLGKATGRLLNFKIVVIPVRKNIQDIKGLNKRLDVLFSQTPNCSEPFSSISKKEIERVIGNEDVATCFQPIFSTQTEKIVGYEALSRGPKNTNLYDADMLFGSAAYHGLSEEIELLCMKKALKWIEKIPDLFWVAINVGPDLIRSKVFLDLIFQDRLKPYWPRLIFEITEHLPLDDIKNAGAMMNNLKNQGISFSLDDTGCGFADLAMVEALKPKIVKLCITITRRIDRDEHTLEEFKAAIQVLLKHGDAILGEGVEEKEQLDLLKQSGVSMVQGFYFERPKPAEEVVKALTG